jgi:hypothetical protein
VTLKSWGLLVVLAGLVVLGWGIARENAAERVVEPPVVGGDMAVAPEPPVGGRWFILGGALVAAVGGALLVVHARRPR